MGEKIKTYENKPEKELYHSDPISIQAFLIIRHAFEWFQLFHFVKRFQKNLPKNKNE